jgi:hypothetical protein
VLLQRDDEEEEQRGRLCFRDAVATVTTVRRAAAATTTCTAWDDLQVAAHMVVSTHTPNRKFRCVAQSWTRTRSWITRDVIIPLTSSMSR